MLLWFRKAYSTVIDGRGKRGVAKVTKYRADLSPVATSLPSNPGLLEHPDQAAGSNEDALKVEAPRSRIWMHTALIKS